MKKPKLQVKGVFVPEIEGMNAGQVCSAYEGMIDALVNAHGTLESLTYSGADKFVVEEELKNIEQALKKAGCV